MVAAEAVVLSGRQIYPRLRATEAPAVAVVVVADLVQLAHQEAQEPQEKLRSRTQEILVEEAAPEAQVEEALHAL